MICLSDQLQNQKSARLYAKNNHERVVIYKNHLIINTGVKVLIDHDTSSLRNLELDDFEIVVIVDPEQYEEIVLNNISVLRCKMTSPVLLYLNSVKSMTLQLSSVQKISNLFGFSKYVYGFLNNFCVKDAINYKLLMYRIFQKKSPYSVLKNGYLLDILKNFLF
jgi:hypothetical protein